jgi:hypothetical protein
LAAAIAKYNQLAAYLADVRERAQAGSNKSARRSL